MTKPDLTIVDDLLARVRTEREDNIAKWGVQTHPSHRGPNALRSYRKAEAHYKAVWDAQSRKDQRTWDVILLEEVFEAVGEEDPNLRIGELIQVAAMALAEAESIILRDGVLTGDMSASEMCPATEEPCDMDCGRECLIEKAGAEEGDE